MAVIKIATINGVKEIAANMVVNEEPIEPESETEELF